MSIANDEFELTVKDHELIALCDQLEAVVAIGYYGRSGSVFLQSLLDGHPQLLMFPGPLLMTFAQFWQINADIDSLDTLIANFCEYFASLFDVESKVEVGANNWIQVAVLLSFDKMGPNRDEYISVDKNRFIAVLTKILQNKTITRKFFFQAIHVAYAIVLDRSAVLDLTSLPIIVHQLHGFGPYPEVKYRLDTLQIDFPKTRFVQMVREPLQTLGSHFKHHYPAKHVLLYSYYDAVSINAERAVAVRLEDLHIHSKDTMLALVKWLGITWHASLLESTYNGKQWWNVADTKQVTGFNKDIISKNHDDCYYPIDKIRLRILYGKRFVLWRYSSVSTGLLKKILILPLLLLPFKMEVLNAKTSIGMKGHYKRILKDWFSYRAFLFKVWKYSLSSRVREFPLLELS